MNLSLILSIFGLRSRAGIQSNTSVIKNSIDQITIFDYQKIVFENNLSPLIISGNPDQEEVTETRNMLLYEFSIACGSTVSTPILSSYRKINNYKNKITSLNHIQVLILVEWNDEITSFLREMNVRMFPGDADKTIKSINKKIKTILVSLKEESNRYQSLVSNTENSPELSLEEFERQISIIGKYMGFRIDKEKTSLSEYAAYIYSYRKELENGNRQ